MEWDSAGEGWVLTECWNCGDWAYRDGFSFFYFFSGSGLVSVEKIEDRVGFG